MKIAYTYKTKIGEVTIIEENKKIIELSFGKNLENCIVKETELIKKTIMEIEEYFNKKRKAFDIPIKLQGTDFQIKVWKELLKIPYGNTCTYGELAISIGNPKAARAVGMANHNNPIAIIVPCHRVIGKNGTLTGYAGGLNIKQQLLNIEK